MRNPSPPSRTLGRLRWTAIGRGAVAALTSVVAGAAGTGLLLPSTAGAATRPSTVRLAVTGSRCAPGWASRDAGQVVFALDDHAGRSGAAYLFNPYTGVTVAQATHLRAGTTTELPVDLQPGTYQWRCVVQGLPGHTSVAVDVRQDPIPGPAGPTVVIPVTATEMAGPVAEFRSYVISQLAVVTAQVGQLQAATASGQLAQAEGAWLTAHLSWDQIGAEYDAFNLLGTAFGTLGPAIDGMAAGLPGGTANQNFTGFHKVELDLWAHHDLAAAAADTAQLTRSIGTLSAQFPQATIRPNVLPLRTHEILEDALRDQLTGEDDYGSGTDMASMQAEVTGTRTLLGFLSTLLSSRAPDLVSRATTELDQLDAVLAATQQDGRWVAVTRIPRIEREQVEGDLDAALESLSMVPAVLKVEATSL